MKKIIILLTAAFISIGGFAQAPQQMSYQSVIRDAGGALVVNHAVGIKISVLQGGNIAYAETFTTNTNANGLLSFAIGSGTPVSGTFASINWALTDDSIKTETDPTGGTNYTITGTSPLLSVPYALYAASSGGGAPLLWDTLGNNIYNTNSGNVGIGTASPSYITDIVGTSGPRLRVFSQDNYFAGMLAKNSTHEYFIGCQGTWEAASGTNSGFHIYDNTVGARRMVIDSGGNMGVGTSSPYNRLDVGGAMAIGNYAGTTSAPDGGLVVSGNVGIGTSTPVNTLGVNGSVGVGAYAAGTAAPAGGMLISGAVGIGQSLTMGTGQLTVSAGAGAGNWNDISLLGDWAGAESHFINFTDGISDIASIWGTYSVNGLGSLSFGNLFGPAGNQPGTAMTITATSTLGLYYTGIGTASPGDVLEVNGNVRLTAGAGRSVYVPDAAAGTSGNDLTIQAGGTPYDGNAAGGGNLNLTAGNVNSANSVNAGGNVIITSGGNSWAGEGVNGDIIFQSDSSYTPDGENPLQEWMRINGTTGSVGIGTSTPTALLSVNGSANNSTGAWGVFSDRRIKTVNGDFTDGLNVINQMHPVRFNYNADAPFAATGQQVGVIAQELEKIAPYMVSQREYKQFKDLREVNNQAYVFLLINAVKELNDIVKTQQTTIANQQSQNNTFKSQIDQLKASIETMQQVVGAKAEK